jgi:RNA polymerase sigma-70 factor (ECF subfamily)
MTTHLTLVPSHTLTAAQMEKLYTRHRRAVHRYVLTMTFNDPHFAEDVLQETFFRAWRKPDLMNDRSESARGWLVTVARNIVIDRLRQRGRRPQESGDEALPLLAEPTCAIDRVVTSMTVRDALSKLTPARRHILVEIYYRQRSLTEVADSLGIPIGTVKSRAHYALRALRRHLEDRPAVATVRHLAA